MSSQYGTVPRRPVNTSAVKDPKWTGREGEPAVVVSRGEPRRSDQQVYDVVLHQATEYVTHHSGVPAPAHVIKAAVDLIAEGYIFKLGSQSVVLMREHLLRYVEIARERTESNE